MIVLPFHLLCLLLSPSYHQASLQEHWTSVTNKSCSFDDGPRNSKISFLPSLFGMCHIIVVFVLKIVFFVQIFFLFCIQKYKQIPIFKIQFFLLYCLQCGEHFTFSPLLIFFGLLVILFFFFLHHHHHLDKKAVQQNSTITSHYIFPNIIFNNNDKHNIQIPTEIFFLYWHSANLMNQQKFCPRILDFANLINVNCTLTFFLSFSFFLRSLFAIMTPTRRVSKTGSFRFGLSGFGRSS